MILKIQDSLIYLWPFYRLGFPRLNDLVYVHYNLRLWIKQMDKTPDVDAISLDNIDILSTWRVEAELPIIEVAPSWLEEPEAQEGQEQEENEDEEAEEEEDEDEEDEDEEDEEQEEDEGGDVQASTPVAPPSREIATPSQSATIPAWARAPIIAHETPSAGPGPSTVRGRPDKQPMTFSRKRGRGI